jgi:diadenosine tetraphosphate (Ap4A) HIT family hydrolase
MREETGNATQARLLKVIGHADFEVLPGLYAFRPLVAGAKPSDEALACVRDGEVWSELAPADDAAAPMVFRIFAFHFDAAYDATGFVGWLHAHLARATGTGHIVVCGVSARSAGGHTRGGIFDYWGCPAEAADRVLAEVERLRERGRRPHRAHVGPAGGCLLCEALGGIPGFPVVAAGKHVVGVVNEAGAAARGHCLFFPRRHVPRLDELDQAELSEMIALIARVARALDLAQYNVLSNNGARAGQTVFHAHAHLVPKPDGATGLVAQAGLGAADQKGVADELRRRLGG